MLDGKIDSVIGRFRGGRSGPLSVVARSVSDYVKGTIIPVIGCYESGGGLYIYMTDG
jgi:hypothetical protein